MGAPISLSLLLSRNKWSPLLTQTIWNDWGYFFVHSHYLFEPPFACIIAAFENKLPSMWSSFEKSDQSSSRKKENKSSTEGRSNKWIAMTKWNPTSILSAGISKGKSETPVDTIRITRGCPFWRLQSCKQTNGDIWTASHPHWCRMKGKELWMRWEFCVLCDPFSSVIEKACCLRNYVKSTNK